MKEKITKNKAVEIEDEAILARYQKENPWGMNISIDIYGCDLEMIEDEKVILQFIKDVVKFIQMKTYGEPLIKKFGTSPQLYGISALQLIETSSITMHFSPHAKAAGHIDIFSCLPFRPNAVGVFCKEYFNAKELSISPIMFRY